MCDMAIWSNGYPMRGDDVPGIAQGAYLPGDEPGWRCGIRYGEPCCEECCPNGPEYFEEHAECCPPEEMFYD